jgi:glucose-6-phosphate 1-dehydrogenase
LSYKDKFYSGAQAVYSPDAYTRLLLATLRGNQSAFVRGDELLAAWQVWDPLLAQVDAGALPLHPYAFGSRGPEAAQALVRRAG